MQLHHDHKHYPNQDNEHIKLCNKMLKILTHKPSTRYSEVPTGSTREMR